MTVKYYWDFSIEEFKKYSCNQEIIDYFKSNKIQAMTLINQIGTASFGEIVSELNQIDERLNLLFFYAEHEKKIKSDRVIRIIERENRKSFFECLYPVNDDIIKDHSLLFLLESEDYMFLWDLDFLKIMTQKRKCSKVKLNYHLELVERYYSLLKWQAHYLLKKIKGSSFNDCYPQLLVIDCKCKTVIELIEFCQEFELSEEELVSMIENDIEQIYYENFLSTYIEEERFSLRMQIILPE